MSTAAPAVAIPTRSEIEAWTTSHLADAAASWRAAAEASEDAFDQHRQNISSPGGTTWEGDAKDAALDRVTRDIAVVGTQNEALLAAAGTAENAVSDINSAQREALAAITAAESDDFTVGEDLSVTDNRPYDEETAAARATAAMEHAEDIRWTAERLVQADSLAGSQLQAKAADLEGIRFDGEGEAGGDPTIQLVYSKTEASGPDGDKPAKSWEEMLLPPAATAEAEPGAEGAPNPDAATAADDAAKDPLDEFLVPEKITDPDQPETFHEALDKVAGQPVPESQTLAEQILNPHTGTGKPGDPRYTKSPLESPIVNADPTVIEQQHARVTAAEQNLAAAQAAADSTARQDYMDGAGPGPRTGEAVPLAQDVFDARAELTEQRDLLASLNEAAAETGLPTAAVSDLPANADVQAFPAEPPVLDRATEALTEGTKDAAKTAWDTTMPDVANMYDVVTDYDNATDADKLQAGTDLAGMAPIPGGKLFGEGIEHGLDALGVAGRHSDDIPTGAVDDVADTAGGAPHSVPDAPSVPDVDSNVGPVTSFGVEDTTHLLATSEANGGHLVERHVGQTLEDLSARLETTRLPAASSFDTIDEAAAAVSTTLQRNSQVIDEWLANGAVRYLELDAPFNGGAVLERGSAQAVAGTGARVVLKGDGNGGWLVLTGFPTP